MDFKETIALPRRQEYNYYILYFRALEYGKRELSLSLVSVFLRRLPMLAAARLLSALFGV